MQFTIKAGAEVDLATTDELNTVGDSILGELRGNKPELPRFFTHPMSGSSASSATTPFVITLGQPPIGHTWDLLGVTTCGADDHTVVAGLVAFYVGNASNPSLLDLKVPMVAIPAYDDIGPRRIMVPSGQKIYAVVSGVANSAVVNVFVHLAEYRTQDVSAHGLQ